MFHLKISQKLLILFLLVSLTPLLIVNVVFLHSVQSQLQRAASDKQSLLVQNSAERVDSFIAEKVAALIIHSQTSAIQQLSLATAKPELEQLVKQDSSINRIALVDPSGQERIAVGRNGDSYIMGDVSQTDAFKTATFVAGKEYVGPVTMDSFGRPQILIAIPNLTFTARQRLLDLSTAEAGVVRSAEDIKGALIATVSLNDLWASVLSKKLGNNGYAYVVDDKGSIIAYPDQSINNQKNVQDAGEVSLFLKQQTGANSIQDNNTHTTKSEKGVEVLSSHRLIIRTGWAVIVEEPTSSVYADSKRLSDIDLYLSALAALASMILSLWFSRSLLKPIRELRDGAARIGRGDLSYKISANSRDELGQLALTFNDMGTSLSAFVKRFKIENLRLEAEETKLKVVLNSISEGILAIDEKGNIVLANSIANQIIELTSNHATIGGDLNSLLQLKDTNGISVPLVLPAKGVASYSDLTLQCVNDEVRYLNVFVARIIGDTSGVEGIITLHDVTKDRELEGLKMDFVSLAAHELRTPITTIRGYLDILDSTKTKLTTQDRQYLNRANVSAANLAGLVTNLLNVSKIERGSMALVVKPMDIAKLISDATKDSQFVHAAKNLTLEYEGPTSDVWVIGDDASLRQVINNLISNAIMYTEEGGIKVRCQVDDKTATISVKDTGRGIPKNALDKLFTKFYRVRGRIETGSQGNGLGLYISKNIMKLHKGDLIVKSTEGEGATFEFSLPITEKRAIMTTESNAGNKNGWTTKRIAR